MGTSDPLVRIEAATLAGGDNNQDRYAYGDGWAFVLDGASSFSETRPVHDGGWYAERLKEALRRQLTEHASKKTPELVSDAIQEASHAHDPATQGICPTSTVSMARWDDLALQLYVLGDSYVTLQRQGGVLSAILTDDRISRVAIPIRDVYRRRLAEGSGFDDGHRELLARIQQEELVMRNSDGGYWIAGDDPEAAANGRTLDVYRVAHSTVLLFTDGLTSLGASPAEVCSRMEGRGLDFVLREAQIDESRHVEAQECPRSKTHDDKTCIRVTFS